MKSISAPPLDKKILKRLPSPYKNTWKITEKTCGGPPVFHASSPAPTVDLITAGLLPNPIKQEQTITYDRSELQIKLRYTVHGRSFEARKTKICITTHTPHPFREDPSLPAFQGVALLASRAAHREKSRCLRPSWVRRGPYREVPGDYPGDEDRPSLGEVGLPSPVDEARPCREEGVHPCLRRAWRKVGPTERPRGGVANGGGTGDGREI